MLYPDTIAQTNPEASETYYGYFAEIYNNKDIDQLLSYGCDLLDTSISAPEQLTELIYKIPELTGSYKSDIQGIIYAVTSGIVENSSYETVQEIIDDILLGSFATPSEIRANQDLNMVLFALLSPTLCFLQDVERTYQSELENITLSEEVYSAGLKCNSLYSKLCYEQMAEMSANLLTVGCFVTDPIEYLSFKSRLIYTCIEEEGAELADTTVSELRRAIQLSLDRHIRSAVILDSQDYEDSSIIYRHLDYSIHPIERGYIGIRVKAPGSEEERQKRKRLRWKEFSAGKKIPKVNRKLVEMLLGGYSDNQVTVSTCLRNLGGTPSRDYRADTTPLANKITEFVESAPSLRETFYEKTLQEELEIVYSYVQHFSKGFIHLKKIRRACGGVINPRFAILFDGNDSIPKKELEQLLMDLADCICDHDLIGARFIYDLSRPEDKVWLDQMRQLIGKTIFAMSHRQLHTRAAVYNAADYGVVLHPIGPVDLTNDISIRLKPVFIDFQGVDLHSIRYIDPEKRVRKHEGGLTNIATLVDRDGTRIIVEVKPQEGRRKTVADVLYEYCQSQSQNKHDAVISFLMLCAEPTLLNKLFMTVPSEVHTIYLPESYSRDLKSGLAKVLQLITPGGVIGGRHSQMLYRHRSGIFKLLMQMFEDDTVIVVLSDDDIKEGLLNLGIRKSPVLELLPHVVRALFSSSYFEVIAELDPLNPTSEEIIEANAIVFLGCIELIKQLKSETFSKSELDYFLSMYSSDAKPTPPGVVISQILSDVTGRLTRKIIGLKDLVTKAGQMLNQGIIFDDRTQKAICDADSDLLRQLLHRYFVKQEINDLTFLAIFAYGMNEYCRVTGRPCPQLHMPPLHHVPSDLMDKIPLTPGYRG